MNDRFGDNEIARLLRLKRYEQPPPGYFENFLREFHRRQRDEMLREPLWSICLDRARDFVFGHNLRYSAAIVAVIVCAAAISITIYQQPDTAQLAVQGSPAPGTPANTELHVVNPVFIPAFDIQPTLLPGIRDVSVLPTDSLRSGEFVPLKLESESLDDQSRPEK
jgi:hypothetical protein